MAVASVMLFPLKAGRSGPILAMNDEITAGKDSFCRPMVGGAL